MVKGIVEFLERLGRNEVPSISRLPQWARGTIRVDIRSDARTDQWFVTLERGKVQVAATGPEPDAVMGASMSTFDRMARGEDRFVPLVFRNEISVGGELRLVDLLGRILFPGPPSAHDPRNFAPEERRDT